MKCPLCGYTFEPDKKYCASCPLGTGCKLLCCPNCGYQMVAESSLANWWRRIRERREHAGSQNR